MRRSATICFAAATTAAVLVVPTALSAFAAPTESAAAPTGQLVLCIRGAKASVPPSAQVWSDGAAARAIRIDGDGDGDGDGNGNSPPQAHCCST